MILVLHKILITTFFYKIDKYSIILNYPRNTYHISRSKFWNRNVSVLSHRQYRSAFTQFAPLVNIWMTAAICTASTTWAIVSINIIVFVTMNRSSACELWLRQILVASHQANKTRVHRIRIHVKYCNSCWTFCSLIKSSIYLLADFLWGTFRSFRFNVARILFYALYSPPEQTEKAFRNCCSTAMIQTNKIVTYWNRP